MKILAIKLIAYGPFTDTIIDLSDGNEGLHVIYGLNEAGKSSALRALRDLLYGIHGRSPDNFIHPYTKMRIGASLRSSNGEVLEFVRRKGRSNTLRAADDRTVIEDSVLHRFLDGVDVDLFETMFGIGYTDLVRGGREIVQGGGDLGQIIFAAGSGITNLREVQAELQSEADSLFRPSGQKPKINATLGLIAKNRKKMREAELPGQQWEKHYQDLQQAEKRIAAVEKDLTLCQRKARRLERIRDALPIMAKSGNLQKQYDKYTSAVLLPQEFPKQRRDLLTRLRIAQNARDQVLINIKKTQKALTDLGASDQLLQKAALVEELYRELGSHHKAAGDRIKLQTLVGSLRSEVKDILRGLRQDLTIDDAEKLRIQKSEIVRIQELGTAYERVNTRLDAARETIPKLKRRISDLDGHLQNLGIPADVAALINAVEQAEEYIAVEKHCRNEQSEIQAALKSLKAEIAKQILWSGKFEDLERLPVPQMETIRLFEDRAVEMTYNRDRLQEEKARISGKVADLDRQIEELRMQQEVPTEEDLFTARDLRDRGWQIILRKIEGGTPTAEAVDNFIAKIGSADSLADAFQASLLQADEIADRLRREADRVAAKARLLADRNASETQKISLDTMLAAVESQTADFATEWQDLWRPAGITPRSPKEMRTWLREHFTMVEKARTIRVKSTRLEASQKEVDRHIKKLNLCLSSLCKMSEGEKITLGDLVNRARTIIKNENELAVKRKQLTKEKVEREQELVDARLNVESSDMALAQWQKDWEAAVQPLGLGSDAIPSQANAVIDELKNLFEKLKEVAILQKRIDGMDRDERQFTSKVYRLAETDANDLANLPAADAAAELNARLTSARTIQSKRQTLQDQLENDQRRFEGTATEIVALETQLKAMCEEAGCSNYEELPEAERRSAERRRIETDLRDMEERLLQLSGGTAIETFVREASEIDPDGIEGKIERFTVEIDALNGEKAALNRTIGEESNELRKMDGGAAAAELAEEIQIQLGRLENDVEHYARLKIAAKLLSQAIERYRNKSQGPILIRASALFAQITGGSFEGVRADFDENGQPVLVGVRPGGSEIVSVDGMSDGTADQLYLSLRLAGLEDYLVKNEPIPFIADDILIKFDDERAASTLQALAQLSNRTQVIFFTHHRHLVELAERNVPSSVLIKHTLE